MKSNTKKIAKVCLFISAVLCIALILAQFIPYWTAPGPETDPTEATTEAATEATGDATEEAATETKKPIRGPINFDSLFGEEEEVIEPETDPISIFEFMILPGDHPYIEQYLGAESREHPEVINSLASTFCIVLLLGVISIIFVITKPNSRWICVFPFTVGAGSLIGYLTEPLWALGSVHILLIALSSALTVVSLISLIIWISSAKYWFMDPKQLQNN